MSDAESFESVMEAAMPLLSGDCVFESCPDENDDCMHCAIHMADRLRRAYDREIRDTAQQAYHRGFEAGRHSMDAEHRAVAMRLRQLPLDGDDTYENLLSIGQAIWHDDFGCTLDGGSKLRDELVRLMGGVSDDTCDSQCRGACAAGDCGCAGEQKEVGHGGTAHDCADDSRGGSGSDVVHMDGLVTYDVLDNERRKAIAELRNMKIDSSYYGNYRRIALAIGTVYDGESFASECFRDRLIHLLGGDQPSGIDVLREMDDGHSRTCPKSDEEMSKNAPSVSITDELRECVDTASKSYDNTPWYDVDEGEEADHTTCHITEGELLRIADSIDEQFDRICHQQEVVLQSIIDEVVEERKSDRLRIEKLEKQRDELQAKLDALDG